MRDSPVQSIIFEELDSGGNEIRASAGIGNEIEVTFPPQCLSGHRERRERQHLSGGQLTCLGIRISTDAEKNFEIPPSLFKKVQLLEASSSIYHECASQVPTKLRVKLGTKSLTFHKDYSRAPPKNLRDLDKNVG